MYFVELTGDRIDALDPKTGTIERWRVPTEGGGMHSIWPDSKGNFWYTYFAAAGKIGRFDLKTKQVKEYPVAKDLSGYGIVTDKKDRVWAVSLNTPVILGYDPATDKWTEYPISVPARRVTVDSKGNVWVCEYFGNKIAMIDPGQRQGHRVRSAAEVRQPVRPVARSGRQHLDRERRLQLAGEVRSEDEEVHLRAVPRARGAHAEARSRQGRHVLVHARPAVRPGRIQAEGQRRRQGRRDAVTCERQLFRL